MSNIGAPACRQIQCHKVLAPPGQAPKLQTNIRNPSPQSRSAMMQATIAATSPNLRDKKLPSKKLTLSAICKGRCIEFHLVLVALRLALNGLTHCTTRADAYTNTHKHTQNLIYIYIYIYIYMYMVVDPNCFIPECPSPRIKINFNKTNAELSRRHIYITSAEKSAETKPSQNFRESIFSYAVVVSFKLCHKEL